LDEAKYLFKLKAKLDS